MSTGHTFFKYHNYHMWKLFYVSVFLCFLTSCSVQKAIKNTKLIGQADVVFDNQQNISVPFDYVEGHVIIFDPIAQDLFYQIDTWAGISLANKSKVQTQDIFSVKGEVVVGSSINENENFNSDEKTDLTSINFKLGNALVTKPHTLVKELNDSVKIIIGNDVLQHGVLRMQNSIKSMSFTPNTQGLNTDSYTKVEAAFKSGKYLKVPLYIDNLQFEANLDLGSNSVLIFVGNETFLSTIKKQTDTLWKKDNINIKDVNKSTMKYDSVHEGFLSNVRIGSLSLKGPIKIKLILQKDREKSVVNIGNWISKDYDFIIDYIQKEFYIK